MTMLIEELRQGNTAARDELVARVYPELRRIAAHYMLNLFNNCLGVRYRGEYSLLRSAAS